MKPGDIIRTDLYDFAPIRSWHGGRVVLLGDAAHAMTPNLGQGGAQAIEDAWVLAGRFAAETPINIALWEYERLRMPKVRAIVGTAWRFGQIAHWQHPTARWLRDRVLRLTPEWVNDRQFRKMYRVSD